MKFNYTRIRNDYMTPPEVYKPILKQLGIEKFDLDVCCTFTNIPAKKHFVEGIFDGLKEPWEKINWMNPPFQYTEKWLRKAVLEQQKGNTTYCIVPARIECSYWKELVEDNQGAKCTILRKTKKEGVTFIDPDTFDYVRDKEGKKGLFKNALAIVCLKGIGGTDE